MKKSNTLYKRLMLWGIVGALAVCCVVMGSAVRADVLTDDDTQTLPSDTNVTLNLTKFDPSLGFLTDVWLQVEMRLDGSRVELDNDAALAQSGTAKVINAAGSLTSTVSLLKSDWDTINSGDLAINAQQVFSLAATTGDLLGFTATGLGDYADWQPGTLSSGDSGNIQSGVWAGYQGTGNFTITVNTTYLGGATFVGNDGYYQGNTPNGEFYGKVIYTYDLVPEPSTLVLLAMGAFGLLVCPWRRGK